MKNKWNGLILTLAAALVLAWAAQPASGESLTAYKDEDLNASYDSSTATLVDLGQQQGRYTISQGGTYVLSGSMTGQLVIQAPEDDTVRLVMDSAVISNPGGVAIYGLQADKVIITLAEGSSSFISEGAARIECNLEFRNQLRGDGAQSIGLFELPPSKRSTAPFTPVGSNNAFGTIVSSVIA